MCLHIFLHFFPIGSFSNFQLVFEISAQNIFTNIAICSFIESVPFSPAEPDFSELHPRDDDNRFSWSGRFAPSLPRPREEYTSAQRHSHFRSYFGYLPGEDGNGNKSSNTRAAAAGSRQIFFFVSVQGSKEFLLCRNYELLVSRRSIFYSDISFQVFESVQGCWRLPLCRQSVCYLAPPAAAAAGEEGGGRSKRAPLQQDHQEAQGGGRRRRWRRIRHYYN